MTTFSFEDRIKQDILLLIADKEFSADIQRIQKKYKLPPSDDELDYEGKPNVVEDPLYNEEFSALMDKYNLPESHNFIFGSFLLNGNMDFDLPSDFWHLNPHVISSNTEDCITLKIYAETTLKDIENNWPRIKRAKDNLLNNPNKRKEKLENIKRDLEILKLRDSGKTAMEITKLINNDKRFLGQKISYQDIPKIIQRLKERSQKLIMSFKKS